MCWKRLGIIWVVLEVHVIVRSWGIGRGINQQPAPFLLMGECEKGAPNEDRPDPPPANQMMNWPFKYYVTALPGGSAPPP